MTFMAVIHIPRQLFLSWVLHSFLISAKAANHQNKTHRKENQPKQTAYFQRVCVHAPFVFFYACFGFIHLKLQHLTLDNFLVSNGFCMVVITLIMLRGGLSDRHVCSHYIFCTTPQVILTYIMLVYILMASFVLPLPLNFDAFWVFF